MFDVTGIRYQTYWFSFNVWWHWWWKSDDDDVICFYLSSVECCTGMLWQCVDSPVFYNRTVWDEPRKAKKKCLRTELMFFLCTVHRNSLFSNKMIARVKEFVQRNNTHAHDWSSLECGPEVIKGTSKMITTSFKIMSAYSMFSNILSNPLKRPSPTFQCSQSLILYLIPLLHRPQLLSITIKKHIIVHWMTCSFGSLLI